MPYRLFWYPRDKSGSIDCGSFDTLSLALGAQGNAWQELLEQCGTKAQRNNLLSGFLAISLDGNVGVLKQGP